MKKVLSLFLCIAVIISTFTVTTMAAENGNINISADKTSLKVGEDIVVTLSNDEMTVSSFTGGTYFDKDKFTVTSIKDARGRTNGYIKDKEWEDWNGPFTAFATVDNANSSGTAGWALSGTEDVTYLAGTVMVITLTAKAAGDATFTVYESTAGTDGYTSDAASSLKVTIAAAGVTPVDPVVTGVAVTPAAVEVAGEATQTFTAEVTGTAGNDAEGNPVAVPQDVVWTATAGSITADGVFTAPAAAETEQTITVTATAKDTEISGTATVTVPAKVVVPEVTVTIVPAKKTTNEAWLAAKGTTMFWGVKVSGDAAAASAVLTDTDDTATTATLPVDLSAIEGSGDKEFGVYVVLSEGRLGHAIELAVTAGDGADTDTATYNNL